MPTDEAVPDLGVPRRELLGWAALVLLAAAAGLSAVLGGRGAVAVGCLVVIALIVAVVGPAVVGRVVAPAARSEGSSVPLPVWGIELVTTSGVDVPLPSTRVLPLPWLRRRLDRQAAALRAWLEEGPA